MQDHCRQNIKYLFLFTNIADRLILIEEEQEKFLILNVLYYRLTFIVIISHYIGRKIIILKLKNKKGSFNETL